MQIENREEAQRSILQMCRGAFQERVDYEMPHLMENIFDPNTAAQAKRKLTIPPWTSIRWWRWCRRSPASWPWTAANRKHRPA